MCSRAEKWRWNHSRRSAYTFGGNASTVVGRLTIIFSSLVGPHSATTASQTSRAYSSSVPWKLSGEYSKTISVPTACAASSLDSVVPRTARSRMPSLSSRKTTRRCVSDVEL